MFAWTLFFDFLCVFAAPPPTPNEGITSNNLRQTSEEEKVKATQLQNKLTEIERASERKRALPPHMLISNDPGSPAHKRQLVKIDPHEEIQKSSSGKRFLAFSCPTNVVSILLDRRSFSKILQEYSRNIQKNIASIRLVSNFILGIGIHKHFRTVKY